jgi:hypothetical protein
MAAGPAIPPQSSERNMPEGLPSFKKSEVGSQNELGRSNFRNPSSDYWLATVTPRRFWDQHPSSAATHSGRSLP